MEHEVWRIWMTKLEAGLITPLPASDSGSAAVWSSKRINPRPQSCLCLTWSGCPLNDDDDHDDELCTKAKIFVFTSVFVPILTYGHESWVKTERVKSRVPAAEMVFLRKVRGLFWLDKVKSIDIHHSLNIEQLLLRIERLQLRWHGHVTQMSHEQTAK